MKNFFLLLLISYFFSSCSKKIDGTIIDNFGKSIENASIKIENSDFSALSNSKGNFKIDFVAGKIKLNIEKEGFVSTTREIELAQKENYPLGSVELIRIPDSAGIYIKDTLDYRFLFKNKLASETKVRQYYYSNEYYKLYYQPDSLNIIENTNGELCIYQFDIIGINALKPNKYNVIALKESFGITPQIIIKSETEKLAEKFFKRTFNVEKGDVIVLVRGNSASFLGSEYFTAMEESGYGISIK
jgi:hypothetical protein